MIEKEINKMELTLDNLVNYIIEKESESFKILESYEYVIGENANETSRKRAKWNVYYKIAKEFGFIDKLKR